MGSRTEPAYYHVESKSTSAADAAIGQQSLVSAASNLNCAPSTFAPLVILCSQPSDNSRGRVKQPTEVLEWADLMQLLLLLTASRLALNSSYFSTRFAARVSSLSVPFEALCSVFHCVSRRDTCLPTTFGGCSTDWTRLPVFEQHKR